MRVAVIGAGIAGLQAIKQCKAAGFEVDCFEQTDKIGGTWVYDEDLKLDNNGNQLFSAAYKSLRTNLPKELMGFSDYPFTGPENSFVSWEDVLDFLDRFVSDFDLWDNILFNYQVKSVKPLKASCKNWEITTENLKTHSTHTDFYDAIFVCNGKYWCPKVPKIKGSENFKGEIFHSVKYRRPDRYRNENVLVIGTGASGLDITKDVALSAKIVYLSQHSNKDFTGFFPENVHIKPDVEKITKKGLVKFVDGTNASVDAIILCTGYSYSYPFLSKECRIKADWSHVQNLYKHLINIDHPTMFFIATIFPTPITFLMDLQARFCVKVLQNPNLLPSKEEMLKSYKEDLQDREKKMPSMKIKHQLTVDQMVEYFKGLENMADLEPRTPAVIYKLFDRVYYLIQNEYPRLRRYEFRILDDETYEENFY